MRVFIQDMDGVPARASLPRSAQEEVEVGITWARSRRHGRTLARRSLSADIELKRSWAEPRRRGTEGLLRGSPPASCAPHGCFILNNSALVPSTNSFQRPFSGTLSAVLVSRLSEAPLHPRPGRLFAHDARQRATETATESARVIIY